MAPTEIIRPPAWLVIFAAGFPAALALSAIDRLVPGAAAAVFHVAGGLITLGLIVALIYRAVILLFS